MTGLVILSVTVIVALLGEVYVERVLLGGVVGCDLGCFRPMRKAAAVCKLQRRRPLVPAPSGTRRGR